MFTNVHWQFFFPANLDRRATPESLIPITTQMLRITARKCFLLSFVIFRFNNDTVVQENKQTNKQTLTRKVADMSTNTRTAPVIRWAGLDHVTWIIIMMLDWIMMVIGPGHLNHNHDAWLDHVTWIIIMIKKPMMIINHLHRKCHKCFHVTLLHCTEDNLFSAFVCLK